MQNKTKATTAILGAAFTIMMSAGLAARNAPQSPELDPERVALLSLTGNWSGDATSFIWPGLPPTEAKSQTEAFMLGELWVTCHLETAYMDAPFSEVLVLGFDGALGVTGTICSSRDSVPRPITGEFDQQSKTWTLLHDSLNIAGEVTPSVTTLHYERRSRERTFVRSFLHEDGSESVSLEIHSTRRGR